MDEDMGTRIGQAQGNRPTNPPGPTSDYGYSIADVHRKQGTADVT